MRDKLIELLMNIPKSPITVGGRTNGKTYRTASNIADHLLENGVIVPPCKVGDVVYFYKAEIDEICPAEVIKICNNFYTPSTPLWITIEYDSKLIGKQTCEMISDVFKLLCRYTEEEAEKALKEVQG